MLTKPERILRSEGEGYGLAVGFIIGSVWTLILIKLFLMVLK